MSTNSGFINLPLKELIEIPIREMVVAQGSIANMTAEYIKEVGLQRETYYRRRTTPIDEISADSSLPANTEPISQNGVRLYYQKFKENGGSGSFGDYLANNFELVSAEESPETYETRNIQFSSGNGEQVNSVSAPLLSIVPIPSLQINDAQIKFDVRINSVQNEEVKESSTSNNTSLFQPSRRVITGSVANNRIRNNSQQMDSNYSFQINLRQSDNEGLHKLLNLLGDNVGGGLQTTQ